MSAASLPEPNLCAACRGISLERLRDPTGYTHLADIWSFEELARSCAVCNLIQLAIRARAAACAEVGSDIPDLAAALRCLTPGLERHGFKL